jgi:hypothetical protein
LSATQESTERVNPLTGTLDTVRVARGPDRVEVQGRTVKPGLAITPVAPEDERVGRPRYNLTHTPTGLALRTRMCGSHIEVAAKLAAESAVDWTIADKDEVVAAIKATDLLDHIVPITRCGDSYCAGDGPEPPSYGVRCVTCDWEWEDEYDEGPLTLEDAKQQASDHECEPWIEIQSPVTGKWHVEYAVADAEAKAEGAA